MKYKICLNCNFVTKLQNSEIVCPKCNDKSMKQTFPNVTIISLLITIQYLFNKNDQLNNSQEKKLLSFITEKAHRKLNEKDIVIFVNEIQQHIQNMQLIHFSENVEIVKEKFQLKSLADSSDVFEKILLYSNISNEGRIVILLTCTVLEKLLENFLFHILTFKGVKGTKARRKISRIPNFEKCCEEFLMEAQVTLEQALYDNPISNFYENWMDLHKTQQQYFNGKPFLLNEKSMELSRLLSDYCIDVFVYLHNRFCFNNHIGD